MNGIQLIFISVVILLVMLTQNVNAETSFSKQQNQLSSNGLHSIKDHYKMVFYSTPYSVEVCKNVTVSGDKTGDTLKGAVIGGIIGKAITGDDEGASLGALFGGIVGHNESNATSGTKRVCSIETRYKETSKQIYSHSTITFVLDNTKYTLRFQR